MCYARTSPDFQKIFLFARIGYLKKIIFDGRGFRCGSDEKMRRMWLGLGIVVVGLPALDPVCPIILKNLPHRL